MDQNGDFQFRAAISVYVNEYDMYINISFHTYIYDHSKLVRPTHVIEHDTPMHHTPVLKRDDFSWEIRCWVLHSKGVSGPMTSMTIWQVVC